MSSARQSGTDPAAESGLGAREVAGTTTQGVLDDLHAQAAVEAGAGPGSRFGQVGRPFDRRAPFLVGFLGALGVACALALAYLLVAIGQILVYFGLAFFLATGLDPGVRWLYRRGLSRPVAVVVVLAAAFGVFALFLMFAVPVAVTQAGNLARDIPGYLHNIENHHSTLGKLNAKYHIVSRLQKLLEGNGGSVNTVLGAGKVALDLLGAVVLVVILTIYLLVDLPRVKRGLYLLAPRSRRARVVLLTDSILDRVGGFVLGNLFTSLIAGIGTSVWAVIVGVPYAVFLGLLVALLDLIPVVGSTIGGIIVSLVALSVSLSVAIATAIFYVFYRFFEDYLLTPRVMARAVAVPPLVTVIATLIGAALLGIIGALVAIPVAAAVRLLIEQVAEPSLEKS
ncbi:MAG TPA: AI-2E family transporter [Solirubrobacteraceae bacterium]|jgi:predicted PurR-regulated permease PerM|nr:AI-2E family transporter [Solirubrobacteraceae bacterium]